ncbi:MAG: fatty acid desaturase [Chitinophagales bacterium]|jgi:stearoyl-CoA desaturase (delta-9 desaturase)|nr:fatty acid desaturase [Chitinophagales bacterium]
MNFYDNLLEKPSYGYTDEAGNLVKPSFSQIFGEFLSRINIFRDKKNWLPFLGWFWALCLLPFFLVFFSKFALTLQFGLMVLIGFVYSMIFIGSHGTFWYHRYSTHRAFEFKNAFWRFIGQHLVVKVVPEEVYVLSHHIHHLKSDKPGDPYNAFCGFFYCFFADTNHQLVNRNLSEADFAQAQKLMEHTGCKLNTYEQYQKYGSVVNPFYILASWILNWTFWGTMFFLIGEYLLPIIGGVNMVITCFAGTFVWAIGIRTFNYEGHGKGKGASGWGDTDFNRADYSINQVWPGYVAGEWHNNHHLFPSSSRSGFLGYQIDIPYYLVRFMHTIGAISSYRDDKDRFIAYVRNYNAEDIAGEVTAKTSLVS